MFKSIINATYRKRIVYHKKQYLHYHLRIILSPTVLVTQLVTTDAGGRTSYQNVWCIFCLPGVSNWDEPERAPPRPRLRFSRAYGNYASAEDVDLRFGRAGAIPLIVYSQ